MKSAWRAVKSVASWLTGRGCWALPAMIALALGCQWLFGEMWYTDAPYYQAISLLASREGHWWTLREGHAGEVLYFNKPPLAFWVHALTAMALGERDIAYRLPELLAFMAMCAAVALIARGLVGGKAGGRVGLLAGCAMALTDDWIWRIANFRLEYLHTLGLVLALGAWAKAMGVGGFGDQGPPPVQSAVPQAGPRAMAWACVGGLGMGAALMTKPLIGLGMPAFAAVWLLTIGGVTRARLRVIAIGGLVGVLAALPWHVGMMVEHGARFSENYLITHSVKRATGAMFQREPWWWYLRHMIAGDDREGAAPARMWAIYGLALVGMASFGLALRRMRRQGETGAIALGALAVLWTVGILTLISAFGDKRNYYLMIIHPGTAWLCGFAAWRIIGLVERRWAARAIVPRVIERGVATAAALGLIAGAAHAARTMSGAEELRARRQQPAREALIRFMQEHRQERYYNIGLAYTEGAVLYIRTGIWPRYFTEKAPVRSLDVPAGALAIYQEEQIALHGREWAIDRSDPVVFQARGGARAFVVVRRR